MHSESNAQEMLVDRVSDIKPAKPNACLVECCGHTENAVKVACLALAAGRLGHLIYMHSCTMGTYQIAAVNG